VIGWLGLKEAATYASLSVSTLRRFLAHPEHPLPARMVGKKLLIRPSDIDRWILEFPAARDDIDRMVDEVLHDVKEKQRSKR